MPPTKFSCIRANPLLYLKNGNEIGSAVTTMQMQTTSAKDPRLTATSLISEAAVAVIA